MTDKCERELDWERERRSKNKIEYDQPSYDITWHVIFTITFQLSVKYVSFENGD